MNKAWLKKKKKVMFIILKTNDRVSTILVEGEAEAGASP